MITSLDPQNTLKDCSFKALGGWLILPPCLSRVGNLTMRRRKKLSMKTQTINPDLKPYLNIMLGDLESNRLEVALTPADSSMHDGHMIRSVVNQNPEWYQDLCSRYPCARTKQRSKHDTKVKRRLIVKVLGNMVSEGKTKSNYGPDLLSVAEELEDEDRFMAFCEAV